MKHLLLACCLLITTTSYAQHIDPPAPVANPYRYCALVVSDGRLSSPERVYLDYGQAAPGTVADPEMAEMAKNIQQSTHVIDILNYLGRHGWEWLTTTTVQTRQNKSSLDSYTTYIENETRYFFRRRTP
jgi:hypothetical protein